jgi:hypothetical protein
MSKLLRNRYAQVVERIFDDKFRPGATDIPFDRDDIVAACAGLGIEPPKNLGDILYSFRYRNDLPESVASRAPAGHVWIIPGRGRAKYAFHAVVDQPLVPNPHLLAIKIPDSTPGLIALHVMSSEQALLAKVRYNRLIDLFTGIVCYSLQNHLRTTVEGVGQVEVDEVYLGVDRGGVQYIIPVEAKGGSDRLSLVQLNQDLELAKQQFEGLECLLVGAQFVGTDVSLFLFAEDGNSGSVQLVREGRYRLLDPSEITPTDLLAYRRQSSAAVS